MISEDSTNSVRRLPAVQETSDWVAERFKAVVCQAISLVEHGFESHPSRIYACSVATKRAKCFSPACMRRSSFDQSKPNLVRNEARWRNSRTRNVGLEAAEFERRRRSSEIKILRLRESDPDLLGENQKCQPLYQVGPTAFRSTGGTSDSLHNQRGYVASPLGIALKARESGIQRTIYVIIINLSYGSRVGLRMHESIIRFTHQTKCEDIRILVYLNNINIFQIVIANTKQNAKSSFLFKIQIHISLLLIQLFYIAMEYLKFIIMEYKFHLLAFLFSCRIFKVSQAKCMNFNSFRTIRVKQYYILPFIQRIKYMDLQIFQLQRYPRSSHAEANARSNAQSLQIAAANTPLTALFITQQYGNAIDHLI
ncbi:Hypothetical_protein [Hexamita inflata]|uniref:Hypothetical_protein n=1 Tax=Hexamita inflata TaxID=28002 RepID=A0ABP1HLF9_9EUKA